ncbi:MAG: hypothetical protein RBU37_03915 [Myxococcota bacterium]|jgi:hypothetical protein|nr:hypothetical protein [Myxococcota bacterium]
MNRSPASQFLSSASSNKRPSEGLIQSLLVEQCSATQAEHQRVLDARRQREAKRQAEQEERAQARRRAGELALQQERERFWNRAQQPSTATAADGLHGVVSAETTVPAIAEQNTALEALEAQIRRNDERLRALPEPMRARRSPLRSAIFGVALVAALLALLALALRPEAPNALPNPYALSTSSPSHELSLRIPSGSMQEMPIDVIQEGKADDAPLVSAKTSQGKKPRVPRTVDGKLQDLLDNSAGGKVLEERAAKEWIP